MRGAGAKRYLNEKGFAVLDALDKISEKYNTSQAAVSLAWLAAQPFVGAPIASATSQNQLDTLFESTRLKLDREDLELLGKASE